MAIRRTARDWTPEVVARFWEHLAVSSAGQAYFSETFGRGLLGILRSTGKLKGRVLDLGCGPGFLCARLLGSGVACFGVDASPEAVAKANSRCRDRVGWRGAQRAGQAGLPFRDGVFDVVCCVETLEHLDDRQLEQTLLEAKRVLAPGGLALFTTPNAEDLAAATSYCPFCDSEFHPVQHVRSFDADALTTRLEAIGYEVAYCRGVDLQAAGRGLLKLGTRAAIRRIVLSVMGGLPRARGPRDHALRALLSPGPHLIALAGKGAIER